MSNLWRRFLCFIGFHKGELHVRREIRALNRKPLPFDYSSVPKDAQLHRIIRLSYITNDWRDYFACPCCEKEIRSRLEVNHGVVEYNEMIFLRDGKCYIATPKMQFVEDDIGKSGRVV